MYYSSVEDRDNKMYKIINGNNIDVLKTFPDDHFHSIVVDPPYGIEFLSKEWDINTGAVETWQQCFRVLKPGGHLLAFSAARTYHRLATNIEGVGFEIRDQIMWLYASGFPKAQDIGKAIQKRQGVKETKPQPGANAFDDEQGITFNEKPGEFGEKNDEIIPTSPEAKQWHGWKTALKPAHEPIVMARKPFKSSTIDNVLKNGLGGLNINDTRIPFAFGGQNVNSGAEYIQVEYDGRYPSNVVGELTPGYQKFFYCPKVGRAERHVGYESMNDIPTGTGGMFDDHGTGRQYNRATNMDSLVESPREMLESMGGYYCDRVGNKVEPGAPRADSNMCYLPGVGKIYVHGLRTEVEKLRKKDPYWHLDLPDMSRPRDADGNPVADNKSNWMQIKNKDPLAHIAVYDRRKDGLKSAGIQGLHQLEKRSNNKDDGKGYERWHTAVTKNEVKGDYYSNNVALENAEYNELETHNVNVMGKTPYCLDCNKTLNGTNDHTQCDPEAMTFIERRDPLQPGNLHPTVKPVELMKYLIKLVTPPNSIVLDPFAGSGTTGMACMELDQDFIGIELDKAYCDIANKRIEGWIKRRSTHLFYEE